MKTCIKCDQPKDIDDFYKHPQTADGHLGKCKVCCRQDATANRNANLEGARQYDRDRANEPQRVAARYSYSRTDQGRKAKRRATSAWSERNPRKRAAQILFRNRQRHDPRLAKKPCQQCGADNSHAHHENYDLPLEVIWLCPLHHKERHKEMKRLGIAP